MKREADLESCFIGRFWARLVDLDHEGTNSDAQEGAANHDAQA